jgi:hypothetical protein
LDAVSHRSPKWHIAEMSSLSINNDRHREACRHKVIFISRKPI